MASTQFQNRYFPALVHTSRTGWLLPTVQEGQQTGMRACVGPPLVGSDHSASIEINGRDLNVIDEHVADVHLDTQSDRPPLYHLVVREADLFGQVHRVAGWSRCGSCGGATSESEY